MGRKVVILAAGSRGDLQPCVALGKGLADRDDEVRIVASARYEQLITGAGLGFSALSMDPSEIVTSPEGQELLNGGRNPISFIRNMNRIIRPIADRMLTEIQKGCDGADLVLGPTIGYLGAHIGEHLGIPHALIHFQPSQPTGAFPHPFLPQARMLGPLGNRMSFEAIDLISWSIGRTFINPWRQDGLKLPKSSLLGPIPAARQAPTLCAFSSAVVRRPEDWGKNVHMTGFWFLDQPYWQPPQDLQDFLDDGPPPVYVGFGSMSPKDPAATDEAFRTALRQAGLRGVLLGDPETSEKDMFAVRDVPHSWLFPRMAAVVHHGGAGTTAEGLRAGVPSLVCPFFGDQPYWADRVHAMGAGPAPLPINKATVDELTVRLRDAATKNAYRAGAEKAARHIHAEDGVARACETLDVLQP